MKTGKWVCVIATGILLALMLVFVSYNWGYMQSSIDNQTAFFSAPAYLSLVSGIPFLAGACLTALAAFVFHRKSK